MHVRVCLDALVMSSDRAIHLCGLSAERARTGTACGGQQQTSWVPHAPPALAGSLASRSPAPLQCCLARGRAAARGSTAARLHHSLENAQLCGAEKYLYWRYGVTTTCSFVPGPRAQ